MTDTVDTNTTPAPVNDGPTDMEGILEERKAAREAQAAVQTDETPETDEIATDDAQDATEATINDDAEASDQDLGDQTPEDDGELEEANPDEAAESDEPGTAIDAPHFWSAEGKEHFATLDSVTQQLVLDQDKQAQAYVTKTRNDLAAKVETAMRDANTERQAKVSQLDATITQTRNAIVKGYMQMPEIKAAVLEGRVTDADLYGVADETLKAERDELDRQEKELEQSFITQRNLELKRMESPLLDAANAEPFLNWAAGKGIAADDIKATPAGHLDIAYKAYLYEQGQARFQAKPKPKPKAPTKPVRPGTKGSGNTQSARLKALKTRADQSGDLEDMLAYRKARREARAA